MKENFHKTVLPNGLRVLTERIPHFRSANIGIWIDIGSAGEDDQNRGVSHFLEHLMFKGTATRSVREIAETMDGIGGNLNAFTEKEQTCFYAKVMDKHVPLAMEILGDMILNSTFPEEEVEKEKGVVLEEINMYEDSPDELIFDLIAQAAWENHPLGMPILGTPDSVLSITREKLLAFVKNHYTPDNIVISVVGRIDHDHIVKLVEKHFPFPSKSNGAVKAFPSPTFKTSRLIKYKEVGQVHFCLGMEGIPYRDDRRFPLLLLDIILGGGVSSRLFHEIREKRGLAYTISSFQGSFADSAIFGVYGASNPDNFQTVINVLLELLEKVREKGITRKEFQQAKEHLKGSHSLAFESSSGRMMRLAKNEFYYNRFIPFKEVLQKIQAVKMDDIQALTRQLFPPSSSTWAVLGPVSGEVHLG